MRYEIWQDRYTGGRYLVGIRSGATLVGCARLSPSEDPRRALGLPRTLRPNDAALAHIARHPGT